jgi:hypothetical protein
MDIAQTLRLLSENIATLAQAFMTSSPLVSPAPPVDPVASTDVEVAPPTAPPAAAAVPTTPPVTSTPPAKKVKATKPTPARPKSEKAKNTPPATNGEITPMLDTTIQERLLAGLNQILGQLAAAGLGEAAMRTIRQHASNGDVAALDAPRLLRLTAELGRLLPETDSVPLAVDEGEKTRRMQLVAEAQSLVAGLVKNERGTAALAVMQKHVAGTGQQVVDLATPVLEALIADLRIATNS